MAAAIIADIGKGKHVVLNIEGQLNRMVATAIAADRPYCCWSLDDILAADRKVARITLAKACIETVDKQVVDTSAIMAIAFVVELEKLAI